MNTATPQHQTPTEAPGRRAAFNVLLSAEEYAMLDALAEAESRSRGSIIRMLIRRAYHMHSTGQPICATGQACAIQAQAPAAPGLTFRRPAL